MVGSDAPLGVALVPGVDPGDAGPRAPDDEPPCPSPLPTMVDDDPGGVASEETAGETLVDGDTGASEVGVVPSLVEVEGGSSVVLVAAGVVVVEDGARTVVLTCGTVVDVDVVTSVVEVVGGRVVEPSGLDVEVTGPTVVVGSATVDVGARVDVGVSSPRPVPVRVADAANPPVNTSAAAWGPGSSGENSTSTVHDSAGSRTAPQVVDTIVNPSTGEGSNTSGLAFAAGAGLDGVPAMAWSPRPPSVTGSPPELVTAIR